MTDEAREILARHAEARNNHAAAAAYRSGLRDSWLETQAVLEALTRPASVEELVEAAFQANAALHTFIGITAHAFDEDGRYYWTRDPTEEEAKAAITATEAVNEAIRSITTENKGASNNERG